MQILLVEGDGIGPEVSAAAVDILRQSCSILNIDLDIIKDHVGFAALKAEGTTVPDRVIESAKQVDGVILGPISHASYPPAAEGGLNPSAEFRKRLDLYANIRPSRTRPGVVTPLKNDNPFDLVIARENTEGFYADRNMFSGGGEFMPTEDVALAVRKITRKGSERISRAAFELARLRRKHVTVVHKANVLRVSDGLFMSVVHEVAAQYPDVQLDSRIVDAMAALLIREPETFDVILTTNMFGDILSDQAAELAGSLGVAGSLNAGDNHVVAQAAHGSAPELEGTDSANPVGLISSVALMLTALSTRLSLPKLEQAATMIETAVDEQLATSGGATRDLNGTLGTKAFSDAVLNRLK